jgi:hypothetical protein
MRRSGFRQPRLAAQRSLSFVPCSGVDLSSFLISTASLGSTFSAVGTPATISERLTVREQVSEDFSVKRHRFPVQVARISRHLRTRAATVIQTMKVSSDAMNLNGRKVGFLKA